MKTTTENFQVRNRLTGEVEFTATIEVTPDMTTGTKLGLAVAWACGNNADLSYADLRYADFRGAKFGDASPIPKIENIHRRIFEAASKDGALDMSEWHIGGTCGTTHCRAGWAVVLAGEAGKTLEDVYGTGVAATLIYQASDPDLERVPDWMASNEDAMADMKRLAEQVAA
jgi:hypothetical protein